MRNLTKTSLLCGVMMLTAFSCEKDKNELPVEFKMRLLDTLGNEKTVFNEGENVIFSFVINNSTSEDMYFAGMNNIDDFFRLYKLNTSEGDIDLGKPYKHIFCEYIGALRIPANGIFKIEIPWLWNENQIYGYIGCPHGSYHSVTSPLTKGYYRTAFTSSFKINNVQTEEKHFEIKFTVK
ncbi:MAG: hypothetical protein U1C46_04760 [Bacteroidales bacterium]|nr:hypothetical protein [Bacteroidales bacterium]MDZ4204112.1 hypothetical protein [Bacteroidales bacterium]